MLLSQEGALRMVSVPHLLHHFVQVVWTLLVHAPCHRAITAGEGEDKGGSAAHAQARHRGGRACHHGHAGSAAVEGPQAAQTLVAQFLTLCRASHLAEARRLSALLQSLSPAKTRVSSLPSRAHDHHCQPSTNS